MILSLRCAETHLRTPKVAAGRSASSGILVPYRRDVFSRIDRRSAQGVNIPQRYAPLVTTERGLNESCETARRRAFHRFGRCGSAPRLDPEFLNQKSSFPKLHRLGVTQVVIYNSNMSNRLLNGYRREGHRAVSYERIREELSAAFEKAGLRLVATRHKNFIPLSVSGGFMRRSLPILGKISAAVYALDRAIVSVLKLMHLDRVLAFRFLSVFDLTSR
jgi:hypothetical protein